MNKPTRLKWIQGKLHAFDPIAREWYRVTQQDGAMLLSNTLRPRSYRVSAKREVKNASYSKS